MLMALLSIPWPDPGSRRPSWLYRFVIPYIPVYLLGLVAIIAVDGWRVALLLGIPWVIFTQYKMRHWGKTTPTDASAK
jgi:hypothetical protein